MPGVVVSNASRESVHSIISVTNIQKRKEKQAFISQFLSLQQPGSHENSSFIKEIRAAPDSDAALLF